MSRFHTGSPRLVLESLHLGTINSSSNQRRILLQLQSKCSRRGIFVFKLHSTIPSRPYSTSKPASRRKPPPPPVRDILKSALNFSRLFGSLSKHGFRKLFRQSPEELILGLVVVTALAGIVVYTIYLYFTFYHGPRFSRFPEPIANSLRRALYYTDVSPDPKQALKYYKKALEQCNELHLDPFSDEVLGIRIQTSAWLQKIEHYDVAIKTLESMLTDCTNWIKWMEQAVADGTIDKSGAPPPAPPKDEKEKATEPKPWEHDPENYWRKRSRLLAKCVGTSVKLGDLYSDEHVMKFDEAQAKLTWAVETALTEMRRRHVEGPKPDEGPWMSPEEIGGTLEALGTHYESKSQFHLAVPLFFQALRLCDSPCHRPVLMNNLAVSFAQMPDYVKLKLPLGPEGEAVPAPKGREEFMQSALNWALNAYSHSRDVTGDDRTPECDTACAVSLCTLGDISASLGNLEEARRRFHECVELSQKLDFHEGITQAKSGLARLEKPSPSKA